MRGELKIVVITIAVIAISGCAALRKSRIAEKSEGAEVTDMNAIAEMVAGNNITDNGFEIRKGSIELEGTEIEGRFGVHARLNSAGDFYASVKGPLGIELARILIVGNNIAAIDRFNRKVYIGKKDEVIKKKGLPEDFIKILFGDLTDDINSGIMNGGNDEITVSAGDGSFSREITICRKEMKVCRETIESGETGHKVYFSFTNFRETEGRKYASLISMEERRRMFHVKLYIDDMIYGYNSVIEFNLPSYEREKL